jgi:tetratricopeptide (TPR) repeat protein
LRSWLDALPPDLRAAPACQLLEGTLEWGAGRNIEAVDCLRSAAAGFSEKEDVVGEWLARFALADPLVLMGELEQVIPLANGFDDESALAAGIVAPAVAAYAAGALAALGRVRECEELSQRLLAHPHAGPLRPARTIWESQKLLLAGDLDELIRGAEEAIREFERFDPLNRLPQLAQFLAIALGDQGRDAEALAVWERVDELARRAHVSSVLKTSLFWRALLHARAGRLEPASEYLARASMTTGSGWRDYVEEVARAKVAALRGDSSGAVSASERAVALVAERAPITHRFLTTIELAPVLFEAGLPAMARSLLDEALGLCDLHVPGQSGSYSRSLLLAVRAWLRDAEGDEAGAMNDLEHMWQSAGPNAADVVRCEWRLLESLLSRALERGVLDPRSVVGAIEAAWPGGGALLPFTAHPDARVRRAAISPAASAGHPDLVPRLAQLANDPTRTSQPPQPRRQGGFRRLHRPFSSRFSAALA